MSTDVALQAMFDRLLGQFVLPLVEGGEVLVSFPLGAGALEYFENAVPSDGETLPQVLRAQAEVLRQLLLSPTVGELTIDEIALASALHNILLVSHDDLVDGFRGSTRWEHTLAMADDHLSHVTPCRTVSSALRRHALLHAVPDLKRTDVTVHSRTGMRTYNGQEPPRRALMWPRLRRVEVRQDTASLPTMVPGVGARKSLSAVLEQSPLTCLLTMPYTTLTGVYGAGFTWSPPIFAVLADRQLCRVVTYRHLDLGMAVVGAPLVEGLMALSAEASKGNAPTEAAAFALRYIVNLHLTHCVCAGDEDNLLAPLSEHWPEETADWRPHFFATAVALARVSRLGAPAMDDGEATQRERLYVREAARVAGPVLEEMDRLIDWLAPKVATGGEQPS